MFIVDVLDVTSFSSEVYVVFLHPQTQRRIERQIGQFIVQFTHIGVFQMTI